MPSPLHIQLLINGSIARREVFNDSPITFGREAGNRLVLQEPTASRQHGEIRLENDRWVLVNNSPNGTMLNGRDIGKKPKPLASGDVIGIGDVAVIRVLLEASAAAANANENENENTNDARPQPATTPGSKRSKLWIGIGVYLVFMLGIFIFFSTFKASSDDGLKPITELTSAAIVADIRRPPAKTAIDPRAAANYLQAATGYFSKLDTDPANTYLAYNAYRKSLAASGKDSLEQSVDQSRMLDVEQRLIDEVTRAYRESSALLRSGSAKEAEAGFRRLNQRIYPDYDSEVFRNAEKQLEQAIRKQSKRRR